MIRPLAAAAVLFAASLGAGCGPCSGVVECRAKAVNVDGRLVTTAEGLGISGAGLELTIHHQAGAMTVNSSTTSDGTFSFNIPWTDATPTRLSLGVRPPGRPGYLIDSLPCAPMQAARDGCVLPAIVDAPDFPIITFLLRPDDMKPARLIPMHFSRTGGTNVFGKRAATSYDFVTSTDGVGLDFLAPEVYALSLEPIIGDFTVELPPPIGTMVRHGFTVHPGYVFRGHPPAFLTIGPSLNYQLVFVDSATGNRLPAVEVEFRKTAGIPLKVDTSYSHADVDGIAGLLLTPLAVGDVSGSLRIVPAGRGATDLGSITVSTFDADSAVVFGFWRVGAQGTLYPMPRVPGP